MSDVRPSTDSIWIPVDECAVLLGLLEHTRSVARPEVGHLAEQEIRRLNGRVETAIRRERPLPAPTAPPEAAATRLARRLQMTLDELTTIVDAIELTTEAGDRPILVMGIAATAADALALRINALGVPVVIDLQD